MNWIKEHKFSAGLLISTVVAAAAFGWLGSKGSGRYDLAKEEFDSAFNEASRLEKLELYPTRANLDSKVVALDEYRKATNALQEAFAKFRTGELTNTSPQAFADKLKEAVDQTVAACGEKTKLPEGYFVGFEKYRTGEVAQGNATGVLSYQLEAIRHMMIGMSDAGVAELINIHRPLLEEEQGGEFVAEEDQVARGLPLELTLRGSEASIRKFLSSLVGSDNHYLVVRSLSIRNANPSPPKEMDAEFERPKVKKTAAAAPAASVFGGAGLSALFDDGNSEADAGGEEVIAPEPPSAPVDTSRMLAQVLGREQLTVFVRLDILQFLPAKELP